MQTKIKYDIAIVIGAVAFFIIAAETGTRIWWKTQWHNHKEAVFTEKSGWKHTPGFYEPTRSPVGFAGRVNSRGYRGEEWPIEKSPDTLRIMMIGDSVVLGLGSYKVDGGFPYRLELLANQKYKTNGFKVEVFNAGVAANTSEQAAYRFEHELIQYRPDILMIAVGGNDMAEQNPRTIPSKIHDHWARRLAENSYFMRAVFGVFFKILIPKLTHPDQDVRGLLAELKNYTPNQYKENLRGMIRTAKENGGKAVLITIPCKFDAPEFNDENYKPVGFAFGNNPKVYRLLLHQYNRAIKETAQEEDCYLIDMNEIFRRRPNSPELFWDYFHPTDAGNDFYADVLFRELQKFGVFSEKRALGARLRQA